MIKVKIGYNEKGQRIDRFLLKLLKNDRRTNVYKYIRKNIINVNGKKVKENYFLEEGDVVKIYLPDDVYYKFIKLDKEEVVNTYDLDIVYEDEDMLVVNKPVGLLTHPDKNEYKKTLSSYVNVYLRDCITRTFKPASIQRLDKNTSGLIIFAKNYDSLKKLNELMRERKIKKYYETIVHGKMKNEGEIEGYIIKNEEKNISVVRKNNVMGSKKVHTKYKVIKSNEKYSLLEMELLTGRSHQIRASLNSIGHPIVGDTKYGGKKVKGVERYLLNAYKIKIREMEFVKESIEILEFIRQEM